MTRPRRTTLPQTYYLIHNKTLSQMPVFGNKTGCESFLNVLERVVSMFGLRVCAYALLPTAFYLVVFSEQANISRAMQFLQAVFTQQINKLQNREGPIFKGRFKSSEVTTGNKIDGVVDYVHNLPVEFGLCKRADDFVWSSKRAYTDLVTKPSWLSVTKSDESHPAPSAQTNQSDVATLEPLSSKKILDIITREYNTSLAQIRMGRHGTHSTARLTLVYCLRTLLGMSLKNITRFTNAQNANAVAQTLHRAKEMVKTDERMRGVVEGCRRSV